MKTIFAAAAVMALAALTGCAVQQPYYASRAPAMVDPYQWHTVSALPANGGETTTSYTTEAAPAPASRVIYTTEPAYTTAYVAQPVYYAPAPAYYYPPVTVGLDFVVGGWCCGGRRGGGWGRGGWHR